MPNLNINAGAPGNPLDALLAGRPMWGSTGAMLGAPSTIRPGVGEGELPVDPNMIYGNDPNYQALQQSLMRNGVQYSQLRDTTIGGPGQIIDPSKVIYDPTLGLIAPTSDIKDPGSGTFWDQYGGFLIMGAGVGAAMAGAGAAAGAGGGVGAGAGAVAPGMEAQAALESQLLNAGIAPGSAEWTSILSQAGLDTTAGAGGAGIPDTQGLPGSGDPGAGGAPPGTGGGGTSTFGNVRSTLSNLNRVRQLVGLMQGGQGRSTGTGGGNMGSGALGAIMSLLGLGALGRSSGLYGGGVGTPGGAQAVAGQAADRADPWGASGLRGQAQGILNPGMMMQLLGLNPQGTQADITKDPGYQFALSQGTGAINMGDAAQGTLRSGNRLTELQNYGTGLAAQYEGQFRGQNLASLGALTGMAGLGSSNPAASGQMLMGGFTGATNLQNAGLNGLLGTLLNGSGPGGVGGLGSLLSSLGGGLTSLLGQGGSGLSDFFSNLFGSGGGSSGDGIMNDILNSIGGSSGDGGDIAGWALSL